MWSTPMSGKRSAFLALGLLFTTAAAAQNQQDTDPVVFAWLEEVADIGKVQRVYGPRSVAVVDKASVIQVIFDHDLLKRSATTSIAEARSRLRGITNTPEFIDAMNSIGAERERIRKYEEERQRNRPIGKPIEVIYFDSATQRGIAQLALETALRIKA